MPDVLVDGRSLRDGYARGVSLCWGNATELVKSDDLFRRSYEKIAGRTIINIPNLLNLYLLARFYLSVLPGDIVEFGSRLGGLAMFMALICKEIYPQRTVFALDTYEGCPLTDGDRRIGGAKGWAIRRAGLAAPHLQDAKRWVI